MEKTEFLQRLQREHILEDWTETLKKETLPLVLWGCGDVADAVAVYLEKCGIKIDCVLLDGVQEPMEFHGYPVLNREKLAERLPEFHVILGHSNYEKGEVLKREMPQVKKVFYAFSIHYEQYEKVPYEAISGEAERFCRLCERLEDKESVENLFAYLNTKMTGDVSYILDVFKNPMSFYHNDIFQMAEDEVFLDIGAYNGDTIRLFLEETGENYRKIIALEPDDKSFLELNEYLAKARVRNAVTSKNGAWNRQEDLLFKTGNEQISSVETGKHILKTSETVTIYADRLDAIYAEEEISFIKINYYEGVLEAIEGCEGILRRRHPKLAIDVGFDIYNVLKLTEYLYSIEEGYKFYLRFNRAMSSTFTLYAV